MGKSLAEIMSEPATVEEIIRKANEINERLKEVDNMPRLEKAVPSWFYEDLPKWDELDWEQGDLIDFDAEEHEGYYIMTTEWNGVTYEGTGTYSCGELILVDGIEIAK